MSQMIDTQINRRTKIIATLGPATDDPAVLEDLLHAGADLVRANFSHGTAEDHKRRILAVRECAEKLNREVGILADLQGPKLRIAKFREGKVTLQAGQPFVLDADLAQEDGDVNQVGIDYKQLCEDVVANDLLLLDDGRVVFSVVKVDGHKINCQVEIGGELSNNKGINRAGGGLSATSLTEKDKRDLKVAVELGVDYIAISFPRDAEDVFETRRLLKELNSEAGIVAKIERKEAVESIDEIIEAADAVMVARGDLGVEIGDEQLPGVQKSIIHRARSLNKGVITATQMMESMITDHIPTRAEVFDVANAVLDGTDAVMLSAETAMGKHPVTVVAAMARICMGAEQQRISQVSRHRIECQFERADEAIAMATMYTANHLNIKAIIALTESGSTSLWMSRIRTAIPIYALSRNLATERKVTLYRGVYPIHFDVTQFDRRRINQEAVALLEREGLIQAGDQVIITKGDLMGVHGRTNSMKIVEVGKVNLR